MTKKTGFQILGIFITLVMLGTVHYLFKSTLFTVATALGCILVFIGYKLLALGFSLVRKYTPRDISDRVARDYLKEQRLQVEDVLRRITTPENTKTQMRILQEANGNIARLDEISIFVSRYLRDNFFIDNIIGLFRQIESNFPVDKKEQVIEILNEGYTELSYKEQIHSLILRYSKGDVSKVKELSEYAKKIFSIYDDPRDVIAALSGAEGYKL